MTNAKRVAYLCNTFGQPDHDRCIALSKSCDVLLILDWSRSDTDYIWEETDKSSFIYSKIAVRPKDSLNFCGALFKLISGLLKFRPTHTVVYGYHNPAFFLAAITMRLMQSRMLTMNDSRFSDYLRNLGMDIIKSVMLMPYSYCLSASRAAAEYAHFLGLRRSRIYYCAIDTARVQRLSASAYESQAFDDRYLLAICRFEAKKNLSFLLNEYARYVQSSQQPRKLRIVGYGSEELRIRAHVGACDHLRNNVLIEGYRKASDIPCLLGGAFFLILPSLTDQFGIVVTEALACGIPAMVSLRCGSAELIHNMHNGYVFDPESDGALTRTMQVADGAEGTWLELSRAAREGAKIADVENFVTSFWDLSGGALRTPVTRIQGS